MIHFELGSQYPVLDAYMQARERVSIIIGPLGSGKTYGSLQRILKQMCEQEPNPEGIRPTRWLAIRNTYRDLENTTIKDFSAVFGRIAPVTMGGVGGMPVWRGKIPMHDGTRVEAEVVFLALDREDDAIGKIRGQQITGAWLNETKQLERVIVGEVDYRHGRYPSMVNGGVQCTWRGMLGDTNAFDVEHWIHALMSDPPVGWGFYIQPPGLFREEGKWIPNDQAENLVHLPPGYYESGLGGKTEDWIRCNLGNEFIFTIDGKPVHPHYNDSVHCSPSELVADPRYPLILGIDFGRTPAAAILQLLPGLDRWNAIDEMVTVDTSATLFAPALKRYLARTYPRFTVEAWGDPAGDHKGQTSEDTPIRILRAHGIPCRPAPSNEPTLRRAALANPLARLCMDGRPAFQASPRCRVLRRGLQGGFQYRRMKVAGSERYTDEPDKNEFSHIVEAAEYGMLGGGEGKAALMPERHSWRPQQERQKTAL